MKPGTTPRVRKGAASTATAFQLHNILHSSLKNGSAQRVADSLPGNFKGGVKTGTTYDFGDNWLFGYDDRVTCGIWIGFLEGKKAHLQRRLLLGHLRLHPRDGL